MRGFQVIAMAALAWGLTGIGAWAQTPPPPPNAAPPTAPSSTPRHGLFRRHPKSVAGSLTPIPGGIVGNKNTHVYHLPGDQGNLPSAKNRVYFHNEAEAQAAGYHAAKHRGIRAAAHPRRRAPGRGVPPPPPASNAPPAPPSGQ
jgi:hypothetical protein